jgi:hypothetical protein
MHELLKILIDIYMGFYLVAGCWLLLLWLLRPAPAAALSSAQVGTRRGNRHAPGWQDSGGDGVEAVNPDG